MASVIRPSRRTDPTYVTLTNADTAQATFTVPSLPTQRGLVFKLTVTDNAGNTHTNQVSYNVNPDTRPRATTVTLYSSQSSNPNYARLGDAVILEFATSEDLSLNRPEVTMSSGGVLVLSETAIFGQSNDGNPWVAVFQVDNTVPDGEVTFSITMTGTSGTRTQTELINDPDGGVTVDTTAPTLDEVTAAPSSGSDSTPEVVISSDEAGDVTYGGSCSSDVTTISANTNTTITLAAAVGGNLANGTYNDCTVTVTDVAGNASTLTLTEFTVSRSLNAPEIAVSSSEIGAVADGGTDSHTGAVPGTSKTVTYTVSNSGSAALTVSAITATNLTNISGQVAVSPTTFSVVQNDGSNDGEATFDVTYTPAANGAYSFQLALTNNDTDESPYDITVSGTASTDTTAPTVTSVVPSATTLGSGVTGFSIIVTFSEAMDTSQTPVLSFSPAVAAVLQNATTQTGTWSDGSDSSVTNDTYTVTYSVTDAGVNIADVDVLVGTAFQDAVGNALASTHTASDVFSIEQDTTPPTVTSITGPTDPTSTSPFTVTVTFSEPVSGFNAASDLTVTNGTAGTPTETTPNDGTTYQVAITPTADGEVGVTVNANAATDSANNGNTASSQYTIDYDGTAPTVSSITGPTDPTSTSPFTVTVTFSEAVSGFNAASDLTVTNGTAGTPTETTPNGGTTYQVAITPTADGEVGVTVNANAATDSATNGNTASSQFTIDYDGTAPTVSSITGPTSSTNTSPFTVTVTFDEAVSGFNAASDLTVRNGTAGTPTEVTPNDGTTYQVAITPTADGEVGVTVNANAATDSTNNGNTASSEYTFDYDGTAPTLTTVTIASDNATDTSQATIGNVIALSFEASETLGSTPTVTIANQSVTPTNISSGNTWVATLTVDDTIPTGLVTFTISNLVDTSSNAASDVTTTTDGSSVTIDTTAPTVTISAPAEARGPFTATFTFSESVTGFELADITIGNGTASDFAGTDDVYTATITPTEHGTVTLDVAAAVAIDGAGNNNTAADQITIDYIDENYVRQRTQRIISNFMTRRGDAITSNQPDYTERLNQGSASGAGVCTGTSFSGEGSYANNRMNFATSLRQMLERQQSQEGSAPR